MPLAPAGSFGRMHETQPERFERIGLPGEFVLVALGMETPTPDHRKAQRHLTRRDPVLKRLVAAVGPCTLRFEDNRLWALARSIISQQISTKAALAIRTRLEAALGRRGKSAAAILSLSDAAMRSAGLSSSKQKSLRDLARHVHEGIVRLNAIHELDDEEVIDALLPIRGIGRWTAQMFLIFSLGRFDVLPVDDLGLRAGVKDHYGMAELPDKARLTEMAEPWRPYRTIATWYFWRSRGFVPQSGQ
ncbi:MAG TPA: DNA-3-methyladenine glycosylase [Gemmataceae bacterium]|nr:DNA-3-methyladenine glycosylase [Gemmataceae bacterium]